MKLYRHTKNTLTPLQKESFKQERDIQTLVEANLETLFNLKHVATECTVGAFRLDTLAFDEEANAFVIIEYKKGNSYSVVDQGYSYLSVMVSNKAEFILEYNEKTGKTLKRDDVDWSASRVIFVSPVFNNYQKNSINFQDVPFELWEIRKFDEGIVVLEQCLPTSTESIDKITKANKTSVISTVSAEVKVPTEKDHVSAADEITRELWIALRENLAEHPDTSFFVTKQYVSWKRDSTAVCFVHFRKKELRVDILRGNKKTTGEKSKGFFTLDDPKNLAQERNWTWKTGQTGHSYNIHMKSMDQLDYVLFLVNQKYKSLE